MKRVVRPVKHRGNASRWTRLAVVAILLVAAEHIGTADEVEIRCVVRSLWVSAVAGAQRVATVVLPPRFVRS